VSGIGVGHGWHDIGGACVGAIVSTQGMCDGPQGAACEGMHGTWTDGGHGWHETAGCCVWHGETWEGGQSSGACVGHPS
jgi:hypothetical protein